MMTSGELGQFYVKSGPTFIELLSNKICLARSFFLDKKRITNQMFIFCILLVTGFQLLFAYPENHAEIWLVHVILFLSTEKCHAKQIFVLSSSMKLAPDHVQLASDQVTGCLQR